MPPFHSSQDPNEKPEQAKGESPETPPAASRMPAIPLTPETLTFRDESGALWWVHEVSGQALGSSRPSCLLLVSTHHLRRIWTYPPDWRSLAPAELLALPETMP